MRPVEALLTLQASFKISYNNIYAVKRGAYDAVTHRVQVTGLAGPLQAPQGVGAVLDGRIRKLPRVRPQLLLPALAARSATRLVRSRDQRRGSKQDGCWPAIKLAASGEHGSHIQKHKAPRELRRKTKAVWVREPPTLTSPGFAPQHPQSASCSTLLPVLLSGKYPSAFCFKVAHTQ